MAYWNKIHSQNRLPRHFDLVVSGILWDVNHQKEGEGRQDMIKSMWTMRKLSFILNFLKFRIAVLHFTDKDICDGVHKGCVINVKLHKKLNSIYFSF